MFSAPNDISNPHPLTPLEAYDLSIIQKKRVADAFCDRLTETYRAVKAGREPPLTPGEAEKVDPATRAQALQALTEGVDAYLATPSPARLGLDTAVRHAYRQLAMKYLKTIAPDAPDQEAQLERFYRKFKRNFPIKYERTEREDFARYLAGAERADGFTYRIRSLECPITGKYLLGVSYSIQPESNSVALAYAFIEPEARGTLGLLPDLCASVSADAATHMVRFPSVYPGEPLIVFEKTKLQEMAISSIVQDATGVDVFRPPSASADLSRSSTEPNRRDKAWAKLGGAVVDFEHMQMSVDGVTIVPPGDEALVIAFLIGAPQTGAEKAEAERALDQALQGKTDGCTAAEICILAPKGADSVDAERLKRHLLAYAREIDAKDPAGFTRDIYHKAEQLSFARNTRPDGTLRIAPITPYGLDGVRDFREAGDTLRAMLSTLIWEDLQADARAPNPPTYGERLARNAHAFLLRVPPAPSFAEPVSSAEPWGTRVADRAPRGPGFARE